MTRAGVIPSLAGILCDCVPPPLQNLQPCPEGFGCSPSSKTQVPVCQLQQPIVQRSTPLPRCQLQTCRVTRTLFPPDDELSQQDVAVLCLLFFCCWEEAKRCEASQQPLPLKSSNLVRVMKKEWTTCGVRLQAGKYTKKVSNRYGFDGPSLLKMVSKYRCDPKGRKQMHIELQTRIRDYYQVYVFSHVCKVLFNV